MGVYISDAQRNLDKCGFSSNIVIQPLPVRCNIAIDSFVGEKANGELSAPSSSPVVTFKPDDDITKIGEYALENLFYNRKYSLNINMNNVEEIGTNGMNYFAYQADVQNITGFNNLETISDHGLDNAFNTNTSSNNTSGTVDLSSLRTVSSHGLYYAFCYTKITSATIGIEKSDITDMSPSTNSNAFSYAFAYTPNLYEISFPNLEYIIHNYTYGVSIPSNGPFVSLGYQGADKIYNFPKLRYVIGGQIFQSLNYGSTSYTKSGKIEKTRFKNLEMLYGNQIFRQAFYYNSFSRGMFMFPSLVRVKEIYFSPTTATGCILGADAFNNARINGPVFFESLQGPFNGASQIVFATASSSSNTALSFANAKNVTEFHFPATIMDCNVQAFFQRYQNRFGCTGTAFTPTAAQMAIPMYGDIVESIVVNGVRYYRDETKSIYDSNDNKIFVAWVHKTITIDGNEYIFQPRLLHNLVQAEKYVPAYGWRREGTPEYDPARGMFPSTVLAEYYTLERDPDATDKAALGNGVSDPSLTAASFTIDFDSIVPETIVYTAFDENTRVEPQSPMYAWSDGTYTVYSENNDYSQFKNNSKIEFYKRSSIGFYHWYVPSGYDSDVRTRVITDDSTQTLTCQFYEGATRITTGALSRAPSSDLLTGTTVYSDTQGTVLGTIEHINNNWL